MTRAKMRDKPWLFESIAFMVSVIIVLLCIFIPFEGLRFFLLTVGLSVMSASFLALLQALLEVNPASAVARRLEELERRKEALRIAGLDSFLPKGGEEKEFFFSLPQAVTVDLFHNTGANFVKLNKRELMESILYKGCRVRMIISDTSKPYWKDHDATELLCPTTRTEQHAKDVINESRKIVDQLVDNSGGSRYGRHKNNVKSTVPSKRKRRIKEGTFELRQYPGVPTASIVIIDDEKARVTSYLPGMNSAEVPSLIVTKNRGGEALERYQESFNTAWKSSSPIESCMFPRVIATSESSE